MGCQAQITGEVSPYSAPNVDGISYGNYRIFVTSNFFDGNLGGRSGADQKCQDAATAGGLKLQYLAVLGISGAASESRFPVTSAIYAVGTGGTSLIITSNKANFFKDTPGLTNAPRYDEFMNLQSGITWTGGYSAAGQTCLDWVNNTNGSNGYAGDSGNKNTPATWILSTQRTCDDLYPIYCMAYYTPPVLSLMHTHFPFSALWQD